MAALTVLLGHGGCLLWTSVERFYGQTLHVGHAAVIAFFAISGYIIPVSIERSSSLTVFWIRRFWRLYPAYWATLVMTVGLVTLGKTYPGQGELISSMLPLDLLMVRGSLGIPLVAVAWTLWVELAFYGLASLIWLVGLHGRPATVAWGLMFFSFGLRHFAPRMSWLSGWNHTWEILFYFAIMAVGTCLYRLDRGELRPRVAYGAVAGLVLIMAKHIFQSRGEAHASALLVGLVAFLVFRQLRYCEIAGPVRWLGRISYSLYLVHPAVMIGFGSLGPKPLTMLVWAAASLVLAALSYRYIEAPAERFGRYLTSSGVRRTAEVQFPPTLAIEAG